MILIWLDKAKNHLEVKVEMANGETRRIQVSLA